MKKTIWEAKEIVRNRTSELEKSRVEMHQQLAQIMKKIQDDKNQLNEMLAKSGEAERKANVPKA